jgi:hypothetical protein
MAKYCAAVRFPDGTVFYNVFQGTVDCVSPRLFLTETDARLVWDEDQSKVDCPKQEGDEIVEVIPYYLYGDKKVAFKTFANREHLLITGPRCWDTAQYNADLYPPNRSIYD